MTVKAVKVRKGLYELRGVTDTSWHRAGESVCGGQIFAEWFHGEWDGDEKLPPSWECYCERCKECDPNGWATLRECVREAPAYWMRPTAEATR